MLKTYSLYYGCIGTHFLWSGTVPFSWPWVGSNNRKCWICVFVEREKWWNKTSAQGCWHQVRQHISKCVVLSVAYRRHKSFLFVLHIKWLKEQMVDKIWLPSFFPFSTVYIPERITFDQNSRVFFCMQSLLLSKALVYICTPLIVCATYMYSPIPGTTGTFPVACSLSDRGIRHIFNKLCVENKLFYVPTRNNRPSAPATQRKKPHKIGGMEKSFLEEW